MDKPSPAAAPKPCCVCAAPGGKHCTKCKSRHYCSKACQLVDWHERGHKAQCRQLAAEFQGRLLDALVPEEKPKEAPAVVADVLQADGSKASKRLSAVPTTALAKANALNGETPDWRGTCAICQDLLPIENGQQTFYSCCCKRLCAECSAKCRSTTSAARSAERLARNQRSSIGASCRSTWTRATPRRKRSSEACTVMVPWVSSRTLSGHLGSTSLQLRKG
jgi:hypothetical protein